MRDRQTDKTLHERSLGIVGYATPKDTILPSIPFPLPPASNRSLWLPESKKATQSRSSKLLVLHAEKGTG